MFKKHVIKTGKPDLCLCRLCKAYLRNIEYLKKIRVYPGKSEYNCFFPLAVGPLDLINILFINIALVI